MGNTRLTPVGPGDDDGTLVLGLGARLRVTKAMSLVGEVHPRLAGYAGDLGSGDRRPARDVRRRVDGRRARVPDQLLECARHDAGAGRARRAGRRRLVHRLQPVAQVLLTRTGGPEDMAIEHSTLSPRVHRRRRARRAERRRDHDHGPAAAAASLDAVERHARRHAAAPATPTAATAGVRRQGRRGLEQPRAPRRDHRRAAHGAPARSSLDIKGDATHTHTVELTAAEVHVDRGRHEARGEGVEHRRQPLAHRHVQLTF